VLERTERVWASDCIDPIERVRIVSGISTLLPFEMIGTHVASERSENTGRHHDLALRLAVALFGHQGIEWDITKTTIAERKALAEWVTMVKSFRPLVHGGELVRIERQSDPGTTLFGVVAHDRAEALFALVRTYTVPQSETAPLRLDGLDASARYRLARVALARESSIAMNAWPSQDAEISGALLMGAGVRVQPLRPDEAALFHLRKV
jgi:alpha-galactosidase